MCATSARTNHLPHYLLQRVGDVWLHLRVLRKDQTGQQGGALLGRQGAQSVLEQQLGEQELVAADLAGHAALQLHGATAVDVLEGLQHLRVTSRGVKKWLSRRFGGESKQNQGPLIKKDHGQLKISFSLCTRAVRLIHFTSKSDLLVVKMLKKGKS